MVGRVLLKGRMFSLGIAPVHTYADPGFSGRLGIVLFNLSRNYLKLDQGSPIAKLEFERLAHPVERPYTGQHGFQSEIWPVPKHLVLSTLKLDPTPGSALWSFPVPAENLASTVLVFLATSLGKFRN